MQFVVFQYLFKLIELYEIIKSEITYLFLMNNFYLGGNIFLEKMWNQSNVKKKDKFNELPTRLNEHL